MFTLLLLMLFGGVGCRITLKCLENCHCRRLEGLAMLACNDKDLTEVPDNMDNRTEFLRLENNEITEIPQNFSHLLPNLTKIDMANNKVKILTEKAFADFPKLSALKVFKKKCLQKEYSKSYHALYMQNNEIEQIQSNIFSKHGSTFIVLRFQDNNISEIHKDAFKELYADAYLDLSRNKLKTIHADTFADMRNLADLNLGSNQLKRIPKDLFQNQENLFYLNLQDNEITSLEVQTFYGLLSLETLDLSGNNLTSFPMNVFSKNELLEIINLERNKLTRIPTTFPTSVREIKLLGNPLLCDCTLKTTLQQMDSTVFVDVDKVVCNNNNSIVAQVLPYLICLTTTIAPVTVANLTFNTTNNPHVSTLKPEPSMSLGTKLAIGLSVSVLLVVIALLCCLYPHCFKKTGERAYAMYEFMKIRLRRRPKNNVSRDRLPTVVEGEYASLHPGYKELQSSEGWDGSSSAVFKKNEADI